MTRTDCSRIRNSLCLKSSLLIISYILFYKFLIVIHVIISFFTTHIFFIDRPPPPLPKSHHNYKLDSNHQRPNVPKSLLKYFHSFLHVPNRSFPVKTVSFVYMFLNLSVFRASHHSDPYFFLSHTTLLSP